MSEHEMPIVQFGDILAEAVRARGLESRDADTILDYIASLEVERDRLKLMLKAREADRG